MNDDNPDNCTFVDDINASFVTEEGKTVVDEDVTGVKFFFCKDDVEAISKIGGHSVKFSVSADSLKLYAAELDGETIAPALIATINNNGQAVPFNTVTYNRDSETAKVLLNTCQMYTYIGAKGFVQDSDGGVYEVPITFNGENHFTGKFVRPVNIASQSSAGFVDAVDFGEPGSYIGIAELLNLTDWRAEVNTANLAKYTGEEYAGYRHFTDYLYFWGYYGSFDITVDTENAEANFNGKWQKVPTTIELNVVDADDAEDWLHEKAGVNVQNLTEAEKTALELKYGQGILTYKNNGTGVQSGFKIRVKAHVEYGWGVIDSDWIEIPVARIIYGD